MKSLALSLLFTFGLTTSCGKVSDNPCTEDFVDRYNDMEKAVQAILENNNPILDSVEGFEADVNNDLKTISYPKISDADSYDDIVDEYEKFLNEAEEGLGCEAELKSDDKLVKIDRAHVLTKKATVQGALAKIETDLDSLKDDYETTVAPLTVGTPDFNDAKADVLEDLQEIKDALESK